MFWLKLFCQENLFTKSIGLGKKQELQGERFHLPGRNEFSVWCFLGVESNTDRPLSGSLHFFEGFHHDSVLKALLEG